MSSTEDSSADSYNGQLLRDIKEVSKALYLDNAPQKQVVSLSHVRSKSVSRTRDAVSLVSTEIELLPNKKKPWDWKKPLKAIAHFGQRKFDVCFLLHVHSIEGLPSNLECTKLVVQWKRKDEVMSTQPSKVLRGTAEFDETLMHKCSVYGSKQGPHRSAKYQVKLFLICASPVDAPWLVLGKHWIDLTRILPLSLEELEGTRRTRKWNASFKLSGLAESAVLNLSFDYSVVTEFDSASRNVMLKRVGSVPSMDRRTLPPDDGKVFRQSSENLSLDLSQSIDFLYEKLDEQNPRKPTGIDIQDELLGTTEVDLGRETDKQADVSDDTEFSFTGKRLEMFDHERFRLEESTDPNTESSEIEIIDVHELLKDEEESFFEESLGSQLISESYEIKSSSAMDDSTKKEICLEDKSSDKAGKILTRSQSLDDITESVANDFLNMLELEECSCVYTSDGEPTSPREYLLREFEKEAWASGNFLLDLDGITEYVSDIDEKVNDFSFSSSSLGVGENKHEGESKLLINRRKAKVLDDLETEDLNDNSSENSPCVCSGGFGSPIELPVDEGLDLQPLGDNISSFVWTKGRGGCIRSMNPLLFRKCKDASHLIMQVSIPVVLVSELGSDILEILQSLAASGIEGLCSEVNALMPLEDIMGKTIHDVVEDALTLQEDSFPSKEESGGFGSNTFSGYVPLEALASLAIDGIELLSIEGLKIQCSMSDQDSPSGIAPKPIDQSKALELASFSLTLDEWLRLDHGILDNGDQTSKHRRKEISAHHAYRDQAKSGKDHTSSNKLTLAFQVLLRDPSQNNEPVGASMLALIQVERSLVSSKPPSFSLVQEGKIEYHTHLWRIKDIGLAGLKTEPDVDHPWCTKTQQQSGSRWLLASGQASKSNPHTTRKNLDALWSITTNMHNQEGDSSSSVAFTRNADVIFSNALS